MFTGPTASPLEPELPAVLNWLRDPPPSGDAAMTSPQPDAANWNQWWLRASRRWRRRIDGPHPLYRRLVKPQVIDRIDHPQLRAAHRIVHAVVACACANEPHPAALAGQLVHDSAGAGIKLSDIQKTLQQVPVRRRQAGLLSKPAPTPEAITRILDGHRIACQADCGQLQRPEAMRQLSRPPPSWKWEPPRRQKSGTPTGAKPAPGTGPGTGRTRRRRGNMN